eukprot:TRINITY_DN19856_c0_g4_i1.p1 TRINITY_DN19856_c0_g4~~TRINITY_DN19856_c0_g4_i1.p1  ORF type:complete len:354 (-),score=2.87 TRINITY_DN19856_c0_g4_i1:349-1410(-)
MESGGNQEVLEASLLQLLQLTQLLQTQWQGRGQGGGSDNGREREEQQQQLNQQQDCHQHNHQKQQQQLHQHEDMGSWMSNSPHDFSPHPSGSVTQLLPLNLTAPASNPAVPAGETGLGMPDQLRSPSQRQQGVTVTTEPPAAAEMGTSSQTFPEFNPPSFSQYIRQGATTNTGNSMAGITSNNSFRSSMAVNSSACNADEEFLEAMFAMATPPVDTGPVAEPASGWHGAGGPEPMSLVWEGLTAGSIPTTAIVPTAAAAVPPAAAAAVAAARPPIATPVAAAQEQPPAAALDCQTLLPLEDVEGLLHDGNIHGGNIHGGNIHDSNIHGGNMDHGSMDDGLLQFYSNMGTDGGQ